MSERIDIYIRGILAEVNDTERNGSPVTDHLGGWKEPGRLFRSDPCYDCGGRHKTSDCITEPLTLAQWQESVGTSPEYRVKGRI